MLLRVRADLLDHPLLQQVGQSLAGETPVDAQALRHHRGGDELVLGHLAQHLVVRGLVKQHQPVHLFLLLPLAPLLLLLLTTRKGSSELLLFGLLLNLWSL